MRKVVCTCDICDREVPRDDFFSVKVKTIHFNDAYDFDIARNYKFDICLDCYKQFKEWQRYNYPLSTVKEGFSKTVSTGEESE